MKRNESSEAFPPSARFRPNPSKRLEFIPGQMIVKIKGAALQSTVGTLRAGGARLAAQGVLAVGAISSELRRASFSNTGRHIWVVAPGQGILSTVPMKKSAYREETEYASWNGTSMATPHVAGAVALYRAKNPRTTFDQVANRLKLTAKKLPQMKRKSFTTELGYGLVYLPSLL